MTGWMYITLLSRPLKQNIGMMVIERHLTHIFIEYHFLGYLLI